jgi:hypothetical protein
MTSECTLDTCKIVCAHPEQLRGRALSYMHWHLLLTRSTMARSKAVVSLFLCILFHLSLSSAVAMRQSPSSAEVPSHVRKLSHAGKTTTSKYYTIYQTLQSTAAVSVLHRQNMCTGVHQASLLHTNPAACSPKS